MLLILLSAIWAYAVWMAFSLGYWEIGISLTFLSCLVIWRMIRTACRDHHAAATDQETDA